MRRRAPAWRLALLLAAAALAFQYQRTALPYLRYDRFDLPAFDPYVYVAMADQPDRLHRRALGLPRAHAAAGPRAAGRQRGPRLPRGHLRRPAGRGRPAVCAAAAGGRRRLGGRDRPGLLCLSGRWRRRCALRMLAEPLTLALETAFLLLLFAGAGAARWPWWPCWARWARSSSSSCCRSSSCARAARGAGGARFASP